MTKDTDKKQPAPLATKFAQNSQQPLSTISAAPEPTGRSVLQSAYLASHNPMQFLDKAAAGLRDLAVSSLRGILSPEVDAGVVSLLRDTFVSPYKLVDWFRGAAGDGKISAKLEADIEKYFAGQSKPREFGGYDIYMAMGWKPKGPIKINGVMVDEPPEIKNMLAVFIRDKNGDIEILDPSYKVEDLMGVGKLIPALATKPKNDVDKRWQDTAGIFVLTQIAPLIPALVTGGASLASKLPGLSRAASISETAEKLGKSKFVKLSSTMGLAGNMGDAVDLVGGFTSPIMKEMRLQSLAADLTKVLNDSGMMSRHNLRDALNNILDDQSYKEGTNIKQTYIPSLKPSDDPWKRFEQLLSGRIEGYRKMQSPWGKWVYDDQVELGEVRAALRSNLDFQKISMKVCEKALTGQALDDREYLILRIRLGAGSNLTLAQPDIGLLGKNIKDGIRYDADERKVTLDAMRDILAREIVTYARAYPDKGKKDYGIEPLKNPDEIKLERGNQPPPKFSDAQALKYVRSRVADIQDEQIRQFNEMASRAPAFN